MSIWMKVLRWALAIPGGILAAGLIMFPIHWIVMINFVGWGMDDPIIQITDRATLGSIERWIQAAIGPLVLVYTASRIAPSHRKSASVAFAVFLLVAARLLVLLINERAQSQLVDFGLIRFLLQVAGVIGAIYLIRTHESQNCD